MLTRSKVKSRKCKLEEIDPEIGSRMPTHRKSMDSHGGESNLEIEDEFKNAFMDLKRMVKELYQDCMENKMVGSSGKDDKNKGKGIGGDDKPLGGDGDGLPESPSSPSSPSSHHSSSSSKPPKNPSLPLSLTTPLLKLDVKLDLSMYNGKLDVERLDNWIKKIGVYCEIQQFVEDTKKIQLSILQMGGTTLIWWESRLQEDLQTKGIIISSWYEFVSALKK